MLAHRVEHFVDAIAFADGRPRSGGGLEAISQGRIALFVAERVECPLQGERQVSILRVAATHGDLAAEGTGIADHAVTADLAQERQVNQRRAEAVDGRLQDVLVSESVTGDFEVLHMVRSVRRADDAAAVFHRNGVVASQRLTDLLIGDHRLRGQRDRQDVAGSRSLVLKGVANPSLVVAAQHVCEALENFGMAEQLEDLRGEAVGTVGRAEARPEPRCRVELTAVDVEARYLALRSGFIDLDGTNRSRGIVDFRSGWGCHCSRHCGPREKGVRVSSAPF